MEFLIAFVFSLWADPVPETNDLEQRKAEGLQTFQPSEPQAGRYTELKTEPEPVPPSQTNDTRASSAGASSATPELG
jgi:hypothetical protein